MAQVTRTEAQTILDNYGIKLGTMGFTTPTGGETFVRGYIINQARLPCLRTFDGRVIHAMADRWATERRLAAYVLPEPEAVA